MSGNDKLVKVEIRTPKVNKTVEILLTGSVMDVAAATAFDSAPGAVCLISAGQIMKDTEPLSKYSVKENTIIHAIIKNQKSHATSGPATPKSDSAQKSNQEAAKPKTTDDSSTNTSQPAQSVASNPFMQGMMNPDSLAAANQMLAGLPDNVIESLFHSNPMTKKLFDENPDMRMHMTGANIRKMLETMSNPTMLNEMQRNQDLNSPGGQQYLDQLLGSFGDPSSGILGVGEHEQPTVTTTHQVRPNVGGEPIPNPWETSNSSMNTAQQSSNSPNRTTEPQKLKSTIIIPTNDPESVNKILSALNNPKVMKAMTDISSAIQVLNVEAPEILSSMGISELSRLFLNIFPSTTTNTTVPNIQQTSHQAPISSVQPQNIQNDLSPEIKYNHQLSLMKGMGFTNDKACLRALEVSGGDVELAIDWLLKNQFM